MSILIPVFNRQDIVERALKSALAQTYENCEIVIVDDGSTDSTVGVIKPYLSESVRLVLHPQNRGITSARNTLLDNALGEWFAFLSSDDELFPEAVETIIQMAPEFPDVNWFCAHMINVERGEFACLDEYEGQMPQGALTHPNSGCNESWYMARMSIIGKDRFIEGLNSFESEWQMRIASRLKKYFIRKPLYMYHTEYDGRVSKSYAKGTSLMPYDEQWIKVLKACPEYVLNRYVYGLGNSFPSIIDMLERNGEVDLAKRQQLIAEKNNIEWKLPTVPEVIVDKASRLQDVKRFVVRVLRILKLKAQKPPEEL